MSPLPDRGPGIDSVSLLVNGIMAIQQRQTDFLQQFLRKHQREVAGEEEAGEEEGGEDDPLSLTTAGEKSIMTEIQLQITPGITNGVPVGDYHTENQPEKQSKRLRMESLNSSKQYDKDLLELSQMELEIEEFTDSPIPLSSAFNKQIQSMVMESNKVNIDLIQKLETEVVNLKSQLTKVVRCNSKLGRDIIDNKAFCTNNHTQTQPSSSNLQEDSSLQNVAPIVSDQVAPVTESWASVTAAASHLPHPSQFRQPALRKLTKLETKQEDVMRVGRLTLGFKGITRGLVERVSENVDSLKELSGDDKVTAAMRLALDEFLYLELNMPTFEMESMTVIKMFFPKNEIIRMLYVEFSSEHIIQQIYRRLGNIPKINGNTASIEKYIPKQVYNRFIAVEKYCYLLRSNLENPLQTNVRFGRTDLEVRTRLHPSNSKFDPSIRVQPWSDITPIILPALPEFEFSQSLAPTALKAKGRTNLPTPPQAKIPQPAVTAPTMSQIGGKLPNIRSHSDSIIATKV